MAFPCKLGKKADDRARVGLLAARFFLGIPESGVVRTEHGLLSFQANARQVPACLMYFSFFYKPSERALRIGVFHAANALASGVGGFIAVGVDRLNGEGGLESWRFLFIIGASNIQWTCTY